MKLLGSFILTGLLPTSLSGQTLLYDTDEEIFEIVEDPPIPWLYKSTCMEVEYTVKYDCYMQELGKWLAENLVYPSKASDNKTEGMVIIQFIIDKSGAIRDADVVRDIGDGCGKAALSVVNAMPDWVPGRQRGEPVHVRYTLPVKFKLGEK
jgi:protein TonB